MWEATAGPSNSDPPPENEGIGSDDDLIQEIEGYSKANEAEETTYPQGAGDDLPLETQSIRIQPVTPTTYAEIRCRESL